MGEATSPTLNAPGIRLIPLERGVRRNFPLTRRSIAHPLTGILVGDHPPDITQSTEH